jgi:hypothetical protein
MQDLLQELKTRWNIMFTALAAGDDVAPSLRLRAEGLMEAALLTGAASAEELDAAMDECYRQAFGQTLADDFGDDWRGFYPFPQIPAMGRRAPVYPSTRD